LIQQTHTAGATALLSQLIDYAGLFPPASLDMAETVRRYDAYARGEDAWMLGRLIVPVERFEEFEKHAAGLLPQAQAEPWHLSALTVPAGDERLEAQLERIAVFNAAHQRPAAGLARIDVIEMKADSGAAIDAVLDLVPDELFPFFEIAVSSDPRGLIAALVGSDAGAKVRTGGTNASMYPAPEHLARFLAASAAAEVPFKATAGMHHPLRHRSSDVGCDEFGFLNVFLAAALLWSGRIAPRELVDVLTDPSPESFTLDEGGAAWRERRGSADEIAEARQRFAVSFGSCSFHEPRADLRGLGILGGAAAP
jgi:hypothetical protein